MEKEFEINGCIDVQPDVTEDEFLDAFLGFIESKGWWFGGGIHEIQDGFYINPDGSRGKSVFDDKKRNPPKPKLVDSSFY